LLNQLLTRCQKHKILKTSVKQRTDSTYVLARIRALNRLECVVETMRFALNSLSEVFSEWLTPHLRPEWAERYGLRADKYHLPHSQQKRLAYALQTGQDGLELMDQIEASPQATLLWQIPAVDILRQIWLQWSATAAIPNC
jgi:transposase